MRFDTLGRYITLSSYLSQPSTTLQGVASVLCDIAITISLSVILDRRKSVNKTSVRLITSEYWPTCYYRTDSIVKSLIINAINRGLVTSVFAALNLILVCFVDLFVVSGPLISLWSFLLFLALLFSSLLWCQLANVCIFCPGSIR